MSNIQPYARGEVGPVSRRQIGRGIARVEVDGTVRQTRIQSEAEVMAAKGDAVSYVASRAMQNVALLSQMELQLAQTVPMASGRLAAIADMTALNMSGIVSDTACRLRRI